MSVSGFWLTFEDALEDVCSMVDADLELEQEEYGERRGREAAEADGDGEDDDDDWDDEEDEEESPGACFELSRSFAEHALGRGARIVPPVLHPGHDVGRRFPPDHRLLVESHSNRMAAEGWELDGRPHWDNPGHVLHVEPVDESYKHRAPPAVPDCLDPLDAARSYTFEEIRGSLLGNGHFMEKIRLAASHVAGCGSVFDGKEAPDELLAAISFVLDRPGNRRTSVGSSSTADIARFCFWSWNWRLSAEFSVCGVGGLFFIWHCCTLGGEILADRRLGEYFVTYEDAIEAADRAASRFEQAERADFERRLDLCRKEEQRVKGKYIGAQMIIEPKFDLSATVVMCYRFLGRGATVVPAEVHPGHDLSRRIPGDAPVLRGRRCFPKDCPAEGGKRRISFAEAMARRSRGRDFPEPEEVEFV